MPFQKIHGLAPLRSRWEGIDKLSANANANAADSARP